MISKFLVLAIIPLILLIGIVPNLAFGYYEDSPYDQLDDGIPIAEITCKGNMVLLIDLRGKPGCAFKEHADRLESFGWGEIIKEFEMEAEPEEEEVMLSEEIDTGDEESPDGEESDAGNEESPDDESEEGKTIEVNLNDGAGSGDSG